MITIKVLDVTFLQDSVAESFSDSVDVFVLEHEVLVDLEVTEAEIVEGCQSFFELGIRFLGNFLVVDHLGSFE